MVFRLCFSLIRNHDRSVLFSFSASTPVDRWGVEGFIVDFRINGTLQTGAVENRTYRGGRKCSFIFRIHYNYLYLQAVSNPVREYMHPLRESVLEFCGILRGCEPPAPGVAGYAGQNRLLVGNTPS